MSTEETKPRRKIGYLLASLAVSIVLMALLLTQVRTADVAGVLAGLSLPGFAAYAAVSLAGAVLRAGRYRLLLRPGPPRWGPILLTTFVRNSFIDLLPARIGSLSFIYIANRRLGFELERATSAFAISFVYDFLTLGPFVMAAVLFAGGAAGATGGPVLLGIAAAFLAAWILVLWRIEAAGRLVLAIFLRAARLFGWAGQRRVAAAAARISRTIEVIHESKSRGETLRLLGLSLLIRGAKYASLYLLLAALLRGAVGGILGFWTMILGLTGAELTSVLPVKGLAGFGTWESAWALTYRLLGVEPRLAILSGIGVHLLTNLYEYGLGLLGLAVLALPLLRRRGARRSVARGPRAVG